MDIEKLKYLKTEVKILEKRLTALNILSDEFEKIWDVMRYDCEFMEEDDTCGNNLIKCKFPVACVPETCPLDRPSSWSKDKK
jgi:hypothetical protein